MSPLTRLEELPLDILRLIAPKTGEIAFLLSQLSRTMNRRANAIVYETAYVDALPSLALPVTASQSICGGHHLAAFVRKILIIDPKWPGYPVEDEVVWRYFADAFQNIAKYTSANHPPFSLLVDSRFDFAEIFQQLKPIFLFEAGYMNMISQVTGSNLTSLNLDFAVGFGHNQPSYQTLGRTIHVLAQTAKKLNKLSLNLVHSRFQGETQSLQEVLDNDVVVFHQLEYLHFVADYIKITAAAFIIRHRCIMELRYMTSIDYDGSDLVPSLSLHRTLPNLKVFSGEASVVCALCGPVLRPVRKITIEGRDMDDDMWIKVAKCLSRADRLQELILRQGWGCQLTGLNRLCNTCKKLVMIEFTTSPLAVDVECLSTYYAL
ncbi:hypothetical protein C8R42DRAFT_645561 [Lentinula raphanica]|nr:hypothetical protein C8R42DRAFT_645561 [Lentinula raphanica]